MLSWKLALVFWLIALPVPFAAQGEEHAEALAHAPAAAEQSDLASVLTRLGEESWLRSIGLE